jgi:hypothetical protein
MGRHAVEIGSEEHKTLFCRTLIDTHLPYDPAAMDWPEVTEEVRTRLTALPIWDTAVHIEEKAGASVLAYADQVRDPLLKEAVSMNGFEEKRHKRLLAHLVDAYGIKLGPEPRCKSPGDPEWAFMVTGYGECIDSFFAFGLFELAKRSGFFPPDLVDKFEPVIQEEGRHILFFVNWAAWHRANLAWWRRPWFALRRLSVWGYLVWQRIALARGVGNSSRNLNFTVAGGKSMDIQLDPGNFMDLCLAENDRRFGLYDPRLLRPRIVPTVVRLLRPLFKVRTTDSFTPNPA